MLNIREVKLCNQPKTIYVYNIIEPNQLKTVNIDFAIYLNFVLLLWMEKAHFSNSMTTKQDFGRSPPPSTSH